MTSTIPLCTGGSNRDSKNINKKSFKRNMDWGKNHPRKSTYKLLALRFNKVAEYNTAKKVNFIFTYWQQTIRIHNFKTVFTIAKWWRLGGGSK